MRFEPCQSASIGRIGPGIGRILLEYFAVKKLDMCAWFRDEINTSVTLHHLNSKTRNFNPPYDKWHFKRYLWSMLCKSIISLSFNLMLQHQDSSNLWHVIDNGTESKNHAIWEPYWLIHSLCDIVPDWRHIILNFDPKSLMLIWSSIL